MKAIGASLDRLLWRTPESVPLHDQSRAVPTQTARIRVRDSGGSKRSLIFLCDPPVSVEAYDELISTLGSEFRVVIIELPGFGFSQALSVDALEFGGAVEAVEATIGKLELGAFVLFGPCICGFVASEICARGNLPVCGLVLMQTPDKKGMQAWVDRMDPKGLMRVPVLGQLIVKFTAARLSKFWLKYATAKSYDANGLVATTVAMLHQGGAYSLATMLQRWSRGTRDADLKLPTLIVWGKQDRSHLETNPKCTQKHAPSAEIIEFSDCGHFSELERPQQFVESVSPFLAECFESGDA